MKRAKNALLIAITSMSVLTIFSAIFLRNFVEIPEGLLFVTIIWMTLFIVSNEKAE